MFDKQKNESKCQFLIAKQQRGETLNELDELIGCETFSEAAAEQVDGILKQLGDIDTDTASAIGDLLLAVTSEQEIAKSCDVGDWPSITGIEQIEIPCLVKKRELNQVEEFIQKFCTKAEMESTELEAVSKALEVISDLDDASLNAVHSLLKTEFSEATISKRWPSMFGQTKTNQAVTNSKADEDPEPVAKKKTGLRWPTRNSFTGTLMKKHSNDVLNPLTGEYRKADDNDEISKSGEPKPKWPTISGE